MGTTRRDREPVEVEEYGCVRCQKYHVKGIDPEYADHLMCQSKHGPYTRRATPAEVVALEMEKKDEK